MQPATMPLLQPKNQTQWKDSFRSYVRHVSGNPTAKLSKKNPWTDNIVIIEGDQPEHPPVWVLPTAQVLNNAVIQKAELRGVLGAPAALNNSNKALVILRVGVGSVAGAASQQRQQCRLKSADLPPTTNHRLCCCLCSVAGCCTAPAARAREQQHLQHVPGQGRRDAGRGGDSGVCSRETGGCPSPLAGALGARRECHHCW